METCRRMNLHAAAERSRSGNGGHVSIFFEEAIPAVLARKLASFILTETMENREEFDLNIAEASTAGLKPLDRSSLKCE